MSNTDAQRLAQRVLEQLRRNPGNHMSSGDLYSALGGHKVLKYTENEFRVFLRDHCAFAEETESHGDENQSPKYALQGTLRRKRTNNKGNGRSNSSNAPTGNTFDIKNEGYKSFLYAAWKQAEHSGTGTVVWNELRKSYKKDTGRHLTAEELNLMLGTSNMTKFQILSTKFQGVLEPLDSKALILHMNTSKRYSELLKMRNSSVSSNSSNPSTCRTHKKCQSVPSQSDDSSSPTSTSQVYGSTSSEVKNTTASCDSYESLSEIQTQPLGDVVQKESPVVKEAEVYDDEVFANAAVNILSTQAPLENDEETVHKFAESLIQHRNSLPDEFGDEIYGTRETDENLQKGDAEPDLSALKSELELTGLTSNEQSTISNGMNAAFLADDSMRTSFCTPMEQSFETSGERGYLTCSEQLSDAAADVSLNISTTESVDPPTPRRTHEITLCSSRNGVATVLPQPDISPLCSANHILDSPSILNSDETDEHPNSATPESAVEDPVPLPRKNVSSSSAELVETEKKLDGIIESIPSGNADEQLKSESFVEDPAPTMFQNIVEDYQESLFEPIVADSVAVPDPLTEDFSVVCDPVNEEVIHVSNPVIFDSIEVPTLASVESEAASVVVSSASPAKPARSIPSITIQNEEETEKVLLQADEPAVNDKSDKKDHNQSDDKIEEADLEAQVEKILHEDEEVDAPIAQTLDSAEVVHTVQEDLKNNVESSPHQKTEDQKTEQEPHGVTFVEEVSLLIDLQQVGETPNEASCTFIEDEPISELSTSDTPENIEQLEDSSERSKNDIDSDEVSSLLTQKSESTITVIQQPLTSINSQVGQEQEGSDSDSIPYDNDESSNSSSPAKTVTVEVELNSSAQIPSSSNEVTARVTSEVDLQKEVPECIPEDEMKSPVDDEPSRDPSIISEQIVQENEDDETNPENIQCLSPETEMPEEGILVQKTDGIEKDSRRKSKKRARIVAPRRRLFNCCTVL